MAQAVDERVAEDLAAALEAVHAWLRRRFVRAEPRQRANAYLRALLGAAERKNGRQPAEVAGEATPYRMQRLLVDAGWDADSARDDLRAFAAERLGDPDGVLIVDETSFLKQGTTSAGVARQYSGTAGRRENQQVAVTLAYAAPAGCAFIDRALYLPEEWAGDAPRREAAGIPRTVEFATRGGWRGRCWRAPSRRGCDGVGRGRHRLRGRRTAPLAGGPGAALRAGGALHPRRLDGGRSRRSRGGAVGGGLGMTGERELPATAVQVPLYRSRARGRGRATATACPGRLPAAGILRHARECGYRDDRSIERDWWELPNETGRRPATRRGAA